MVSFAIGLPMVLPRDTKLPYIPGESPSTEPPWVKGAPGSFTGVTGRHLQAGEAEVEMGSTSSMGIRILAGWLQDDRFLPRGFQKRQPGLVCGYGYWVMDLPGTKATGGPQRAYSA